MKWLFVATAWCALAYSLPERALKPLFTYFGLPLDARPTWWVALAAVIAAGLVLLLMFAFRREGAPQIVSWGPILFIVLSQVMWLFFFRGFAAAGASMDELLARASVPWPLWILGNGLLVSAGFAGGYLAPQGDPGPPGKSWMLWGWIWVGLQIVVMGVAIWGMLTVREILKVTGA